MTTREVKISYGIISPYFKLMAILRTEQDMEGILRIIYRKDSRVNRWNVARGYGKLKSRKRPLKDW